MTNEKKNKGGRPPHEPNDITRARVKDMASFGLSQKIIAARIGITSITLVKYYPNELTVAKADRLVEVARTLYGLAIGGDRASCMFILKTQDGWQEVIKAVEDDQDEAAPVSEIKFTVVK